MPVFALKSSIIDILKRNDFDEDIFSEKTNDNSYSFYFANSLIFTLKIGNKNYLYIKKKYHPFFADIIATEFLKSMPDFFRTEYNCIFSGETLFNPLQCWESFLMQAYKDNFTYEFGCCHLYNECSDSLKCINDDRKRARACMYRKNLESGNIFYGKNKTI